MLRLRLNRLLTLGLFAGALAMAWPASGASAQIPINIETTPPGATVYLDSPDGQNLGVTPIRRVRVGRGSHTLIFRLARHREARLPINVRRWGETFRQVLDPMGEIMVSAANSSATGANVKIDGQPVGQLPVQQIVEPGRHLIQVEREGYVTFTQWVQIAGAQQLTLPVLLEREAPQTGSILVAADVSGAAIYVDGDPRGSTPTVIDGVPAGIHQVEIRADGFDTQTQAVEVRAGERSRVEVQLRPDAPAAGTLVVVTQPRGATVTLDGQVLGEGPVTQEGVAVGEHILEVSLEGHTTDTRNVTIEPGGRQAVQIVLEAVEAPPGDIIVRSSTPGATVIVDGEDRGAPPVVLEQQSIGTHAIVIRAPGFEEHRATCSVGPGQNCEIEADLGAEPVAVRVVANVPGTLYVDGVEIGPVPYEGTVPSGNRRLEVRAPGYQTHVAQVMLTPGSSEVRSFDVFMTEEGALTPEERAEQDRMRRENYAGQTSWAANTIPTSQALIDLSVGYPNLFQIRAGTGFTDWMDGGIGIRGNHRLFEFDARVRAAWRPLTNQIGLGGQIVVGGGLGPNGANSVHVGVEALASILFAKRAAFTLWLGFDIYSDKSDFTYAGVDPLNPNLRLQTSDSRDNTGMIRLGGAFEIRLSDYWNMFAMFEGNVLGGTRDIYTGLFRASDNAQRNPDNTRPFGGQFGFTYKFH